MKQIQSPEETFHEALQKEACDLFRNIRHLCNTCQPPNHLTIEMLTSILETLRGTRPITDKGE